MLKIGRNDPCPCGSGKKFKKCHLGREDELIKLLPENTAEKIAALPQVSYGRTREILSRLDAGKLTRTGVGIKFIDLGEYLKLGLDAREVPPNLDQVSAGQMINPFKTMSADPEHVYLAITPGVTDSTLIHQLAHALDYLDGSKINPGLPKPLSLELDLPSELLEHPKEFGDWLEFLSNEFSVELDAEDAIVNFLHQKGFLIPGEVIQSGDHKALEDQVTNALKFLRINQPAIDRLIKEKTGYISKTGPDMN